jgi:hypothetical protein
VSKHRTREENTARKGLRILNERKRAKAALIPVELKSPAKARGCWSEKVPTHPGERFGRLVAIELGEPYQHPSRPKERRERWWYACDCGNRALWQPSTVRSNVRNGWGCCSECVWTIRAAGEPVGACG